MISFHQMKPGTCYPFLCQAVNSLRMSGAGRVKKDGEDGLVVSVESRRSNVVHVTHNDLDAVGSDAIHRMKFGEIMTIFCSVGSFPGILDRVAGVSGKGDLLSISDLGFQRQAQAGLEKAKKNGWRIEWRDHHRWNRDEIDSAEPLTDLLAVDVSTCACGICARDLLPDNAMAQEVARVVCDYDLWKNQDPRAAVLGQVLQRKKNRDHVRDCLIKGIFTDEIIEKEYSEIRNEMNGMMEKSARKSVILGKKYKIAFAPLYGYPSETAAYIRNSLSTDIEVIVSKNGRFSLRSVPPVSHLIAREFSGGGHPNAAGGSFEFSHWDRFLFWLFRKNSHFDKFVKLAETM